MMGTLSVMIRHSPCHLFVAIKHSSPRGMELGVVGKGNQDDVFEHWEHQDVWQGEVSAAESDARQQAVCPAPAHEAGYAEIASTVEAEDEVEAEPTEVWV